MKSLRRFLLKALLRFPDRLLIKLSGKAPIRVEGAELQASLQLMFANAANFSHRQWVDIQALRQLLAKENTQYALPGEAMNSVREFRVANIMVKVYQPAQRDGSALLYLHGGGWIVGGTDASDSLSRYLAKKTQSTVFSVDYRLAPEAPFPAACNDSLDAYQWLLENLDKFSIDANKVFIAGDSAGANLVSAVCQDCYYRHLRLPCGQILISPFLEPNGERRSRALFAEGFGLNAEALEFFLHCYLGNFSDRDNPRVNTLKQLADIESPATLVVTAGFDPLRDEAREYATILRDKNVYVELIEYRAMVHGFFFFAGVCPRVHAALDNCCAHINKFKTRIYT